MAKHVDIIMKELKCFLDDKLVMISKDLPAVAFSKPFITRVIDNNLHKVESMLKQFADKDGCLDIGSILDEMIQNVTDSKPFKVDTGVIGEVCIGDGKIKMDIPYIDKTIVLNRADLLELKQYFV